MLVDWLLERLFFFRSANALYNRFVQIEYFSVNLDLKIGTSRLG